MSPQTPQQRAKREDKMLFIPTSTRRTPQTGWDTAGAEQRYLPQSYSGGQELMAGVSLFLAMVYIVVVIPSILANTGLSKETLMANTILFCSVGTLVFAAATRLPFAVGPGIVPCALLATFLHTRGIPWPQVCGIGVIAGGVFSVLAWSGLLTRLAQGTPTKLKLAIKVAIGFYLMAIAAVSSGLAAPQLGFL